MMNNPTIALHTLSQTQNKLPQIPDVGEYMKQRLWSDWTDVQAGVVVHKSYEYVISTGQNTWQ